MAVTARRTVAKVKSSAMSPRQPDEPNLMGEAVVFGVALMGGYSTRSAIVLKDERGGKRGGALLFPSPLRNSAPSASLYPEPRRVRYLSVFVFDTEVTENSHDSNWGAISDRLGYVWFDGGGAQYWAVRRGEEVGGLRQYLGGCRVH